MSIRAILRWFLSKAMLLVSMLLILSVIVFYVAKLAPGDPLQSFYGDAMESMGVEEIEAAKNRLGLNGPVWEQYLKWGSHVLQGDFGISLKYKKPVIDVVAPLIGNTLILGGTAFILVFLLAVALALICARYEDTYVDQVICRIGTFVYYIPAFWMSVILILIFSINLKWFPGSGAYSIGKSGDVIDRIDHMVLPLIVMVASHVWYYAYMIRNKLLDEVRQDYVLLARVKGLGKMEVLMKHCLRNVLPTIVSIMAISVPHIVGGTYVVEAVFNYPGIGLLSVSSAKYHDYNLLMLLVLMTGVLVIISSMIAQTVNEIIDPRMKAQEGMSC